MPSDRKKKSTPTPPAPKRRATTREAQLAQRANEFALKTTGRSFGAPVSAQQILYYEAATKSLRKSKTLAQFLAFKSNEAALRALKNVAQGTSSSATLPPATRTAFTKLSTKLDALHRANSQVNKTWPRKHAIVLHALLSEKPPRKPAARKPKPAPTAPVAQTPEQPTA